MWVRSPSAILGQIAIRLDRLGCILFVSVLFMLNATLFFTLNTGMDMYGFFTLEPVSAYPLPAVMSTLLSCLMAIVAYILYRWLLGRRAWLTGDGWGPFTRGAVLSGIPVFVAFAPAILLTSVGGKPNLISVAGLTAGSLCVTCALSDPEMNLDHALARNLFIGAIAAILVFLILSIGAMLVLYTVGEHPASGNLLWKWEYEWSKLGYPPEQFQQRQREALVAYTLTGSGFMIVVLGGSMLGAILGQTRNERYADNHLQYADSRPGWPAWVARIAGLLEPSGPSSFGEAEHVAVCGGREIELTRAQYHRLIAEKDDLLRDVGLFVDKVAGNVFLQTGEGWTKLDFRVGDSTAGIRSGPFSLLCIYARYPGRWFTNRELQTLVEQTLSGRESLNVRDLISQLQRRKPRLPLERNNMGSSLDESVGVCLVEHRQKPGDRGRPKTSGPPAVADSTSQ